MTITGQKMPFKNGQKRKYYITNTVEVEIKSATIQELNVTVKASIKLNSNTMIKDLILDAVTMLTGNGTIQINKKTWLWHYLKSIF